MKYIVFAILLTTIKLLANGQVSADITTQEINLSPKKIETIDSNSSDIKTNIYNTDQKLYIKKDDFLYIDKSIINDLNNIINQKNIKIKNIKKNQKTNALIIFLDINNETNNLIITLKNFDWRYTKDNKNIILENIDIDISIPWVNYLIKDSLIKNNGYIQLSNNVKIASLLEIIKPTNQTIYKKDLPQTTTIK